MALSLTHTFVCGIADDAAAQAAGEILPSHWNAALTTSMATARLLGRITASTGAIEELTAAQGTAFLDAVVGDAGAGGTKGLVPAPAAGDAAASKFLKADGTWAVAGGALTVGSSAIGSGTAGRLLYETAGNVLGEVTGATSDGTNLTLAGMLTITQATANAKILGSTGYSLTGSDATGMIDLAGTWNTTGNPVAIKLAITNTASGATSKFISLLAGASGTTEVVSVGVAGNLILAAGSASVPSVAFPGSANTGIFSHNSGAVSFTNSGVVSVVFSSANYVNLSANVNLGWASNVGASTYNADVAFGRASAGVIEVNDGAFSGAKGAYRDLIVRSLFCAPSSANGQSVAIKSLTELLAIAAAATSTTTIQIPAGAIVVSVNVRVTTAVTCTSTFTVGDGSTVDKFNTAAVSKALNSTDKGTKAGAVYYAAATSIVITPDTVPSDATGRVRVTIAYLEATAPTS